MTRRTTRGRHRRRSLASRSAGVGAPLAVGAVVAGAALVGAALDGGLRQDGDGPSRWDGSERGTLLTFPGPTASTRPDTTASTAPRRARSEASSVPAVPADSRAAATRSGVRERATRGSGRAPVAGTMDQRGGTPSESRPTPRAADGPDEPPPGQSPPSAPVDVPPLPVPSLPVPTLPVPAVS